MREKILIIGMVNSIHLANWIERIADSDFEIHVFPSRHYKSIHPKLSLILKENAHIRIFTILPNNIVSIYMEYFLDKRYFNVFRAYSRPSRLRRILRKNSYKIIHAIEIQHAGYLLTKVCNKDSKPKNLIVTNWGSDIFYFSQFAKDKSNIRKTLELADFYSAECKRDYDLARKYGFSGVELPLVPNSTTFAEDFFENEVSRSESRNQVIMKCYGDTFGLGNLLLNIANNILSTDNAISVYAYSVTEDLSEVANVLALKFPSRFRFSTLKRGISHLSLLEQFKKSRVYIGASRSDGISTSFLEALATGAFPIQTSTSCAGEWIEAGAVGAIVEPIEEEIQNALYAVLYDFEKLEYAQSENRKIARERLSFEKISEITKTFYQI